MELGEPIRYYDQYAKIYSQLIKEGKYDEAKSFHQLMVQNMYAGNVLIRFPKNSTEPSKT